MQISLSPILLFRLLVLSSSVAAAVSPPSSPKPQDLVRSSCIHSRYPHLCLRTLSAYARPSITPKDLAQAALKVSLDHARRLSHYLRTHAPSVAPSSAGESSRRRRRSALRDCAEQISDSVEDLSRSLKELQHLRTATFQWQMSNAQTWVSAAMTDDDTCLDGLGLDVDGHDVVVGKIKRKISRLARVTSNALYMINRLCETRGMSEQSEPSD